MFQVIMLGRTGAPAFCRATPAASPARPPPTMTTSVNSLPAAAAAAVAEHGRKLPRCRVARQGIAVPLLGGCAGCAGAGHLCCWCFAAVLRVGVADPRGTEARRNGMNWQQDGRKERARSVLACECPVISSGIAAANIWIHSTARSAYARGARTGWVTSASRRCWIGVELSGSTGVV